jgi:nitrate reductase NapAB chaperone NapD
MLKRIITLLLVATIFGQIYGQSTGNDIPAFIKRQFKRDASRLALRIEGEKDDLRFMDFEVPKSNYNSIYNALCALYTKDENVRSLLKCNISTFPDVAIDQCIIIFNRNVTWSAPLKQGINETTNPQLNKIFDKFQLVIEKYVQWNEGKDAITIRSKESKNIASIATEIQNIPGVVSIDLSIPRLKGNDIKARRVNGAWEFDFLLHIGNALDNKVHQWKYKFLDNGNVQFISETGDPIPGHMRCMMEENLLVNKF